MPEREQPIKPFSATSEPMEKVIGFIEVSQPMGPDSSFQVAAMSHMIKGLETISQQIEQLTQVVGLLLEKDD